MRISYQWLKKYVALPDLISALEVAEKLKLSTVEVESVEDASQSLDKVVVGKVISAEKHPNADKLKVCRVDVGSEKLDIVCGGSNVEAGMLVAVAKNGAKVKWHGEGDPIELKPAKIRGVESNGMICGADEIGLAGRFPKKDEKEIVDLSSLKLKPGQPLAQALGSDDAIFEIDNKSLSNRPDLWGHYGLAREVAALFDRSVAAYKIPSPKKGSGVNVSVKVEDSQACPRYMAVAMSGVVVGSSPAWLQQQLSAVGIRPINNIVDATNFVMLDLGQPLHAFDAKHVPGGAIVVRPAKSGEKITTLDGKQRQLDQSMLLIASSEKPLAVAGVMGGEQSGITEDTTEIIIESANFNAGSIRRTSSKLGLRTDASARFEKSLDPTLTEWALARAVTLIQELSPRAKVASKVIDQGKPKLFTGPLEISLNFFEQKIGLALPSKTIATILSRLGFGVKAKSSYLLVTIPTWRATKDISRAEDVVEEVIRIYGYDQVPAALPSFPIVPPPMQPLKKLQRSLVDVLVKEHAFTEVYNYSFVSAAQIKQLGDDVGRYIELDNPLSKEKPYLRRCLVLNLLENLNQNLANRSTVKLVEVGQVFEPEATGFRAEPNSDDLLPKQDTYLTAVYAAKKDRTPFLELRRVVETLASGSLPDLKIVAAKEVKIARHPARNAELFLRGQLVGALYELHPEVGKRFGLSERVGVLKLNLSALADHGQDSAKRFTSLSLYPSVTRDVAFIVNKEHPHQKLQSAMAKIDPLITAVELFDVYEGEKIGAEYKSLAYHLTYQSPERTLTAEEVDAIQKKVEQTLVKSFQAEVRS